MALRFRKRRTTAASGVYRVAGIDLEIPHGYKLPRFQAEHRLYDRFVAVLGEALPEQALIVDVGANIGDSAAALCCAGRKTIVCIEPSETYSLLLEKNAQVLRSRGHEVVCLKEIVGVAGRGWIMEAESTGRTVATSDGRRIRALDELLKPLLRSDAEPVLLKSDTDEADADVILSARQTIGQRTPLLFWEAAISTVGVLAKYRASLEFLQQAGYDKYTVFDNFGDILFEAEGIEVLSGIYGYIFSLARGESTRTFYYVDVLASTGKYRSIHDASVATFRRRYLSGP